MDVQCSVAHVATGLLLLVVHLDVSKAEEIADFKGTIEVSTVTLVAVCSVSVLVVIFVISLCGGCTPMEVGSDDHAAAGGRKSNNYDSVATDVNTHVMSSGTTLPSDDPYQPPSQAMPYPLHPETAQTFAGYQSQQQPMSTGYQGHGLQQGYQPPGANRHFSESEPPPPNYFEAVQTPGGQGRPGVQATAPTQQYGW